MSESQPKAIERNFDPRCRSPRISEKMDARISHVQYERCIDGFHMTAY
jgi:hypothetical protein